MPRWKLILLWFVCQFAALLTALRMAWAIPRNPDRAWLIAIAYDRLANAAANDHLPQTISSRAYKAKTVGKRWGCWLCKVLDWFDPGHCAASVEWWGDEKTLNAERPQE
ncbi:MAG: hypothetical protein FWD50_08085 [Betaproteobacteria bacterium]|nr:hypothetical protein [Betaproteobacteria bacterium]